MKGTKEFYELMNQFGKDVAEIVYGHSFKRVSKYDKVPAGIFYHDGVINTLFQTYMRGYQNGKSV